MFSDKNEEKELPEPKLKNRSQGRFQNNKLTFIECSICYEIFDTPVSLLCGHTFCFECLTNSIQTLNSCPLCRRPYCINPYTQKNQVIQELVEILLDLQADCTDKEKIKNNIDTPNCSNIEKEAQEIEKGQLARTDYIQRLQKQISCNACQEIVFEPIFIQDCNELFCKTCLMKHLLTEATCPSCKSYQNLGAYNISINNVNVLVKEVIENYFKSSENDRKSKMEDFQKLLRKDLKFNKMRGTPTFVYNISLRVGSEVEFHFFEPRYFQMMNLALEGSNQICIHEFSEKFPTTASIMEISKVQSIPGNRYYCMLQCVYRGRVNELFLNDEQTGEKISFSASNFKKHMNKLWMADCQLLIDQFPLEDEAQMKEIFLILIQIFTSLEKVISKISQPQLKLHFQHLVNNYEKELITEIKYALEISGQQKLSEIRKQTLDYISTCSLNILGILKINPEMRKELYGSRDIYQRFLALINFFPQDKKVLQASNELKQQNQEEEEKNIIKGEFEQQKQIQNLDSKPTAADLDEEEGEKESVNKQTNKSYDLIEEEGLVQLKQVESKRKTPKQLKQENGEEENTGEEVDDEEDNDDDWENEEDEDQLVIEEGSNDQELEQNKEKQDDVSTPLHVLIKIFDFDLLFSE